MRDENIKLLESNEDTPTCLLEAAVIQWYWLQDSKPEMDQFNSIHKKLIGKWREVKPYLTGDFIHRTSLDNVENSFTIAYMEDVFRRPVFGRQRCRSASLERTRLVIRSWISGHEEGNRSAG